MDWIDQTLADVEDHLKVSLNVVKSRGSHAIYDWLILSISQWSGGILMVPL